MCNLNDYQILSKISLSVYSFILIPRLNKQSNYRVIYHFNFYLGIKITILQNKNLLSMAYHILFNQNTPNQFKEQIANSDYTGFQLI